MVVVVVVVMGLTTKNKTLLSFSDVLGSMPPLVSELYTECQLRFVLSNKTLAHNSLSESPSPTSFYSAGAINLSPHATDSDELIRPLKEEATATAGQHACMS